MEQVQVISRKTIPPVARDRVVERLGELREFACNDRLRDFLVAGGDPSIGWVSLVDGDSYRCEADSTRALLVVYAGSGRIVGEERRPLTAGDVVVVPADRAMTIVAGPAGLHGLALRFVPELERERDSAFVPADGETLDGLLAYNATRLSQWLERPIFELLAGGTLDDPAKRKAYLQALQIWVDGNQTLLFSRQASCFDPVYKAMFLHHMSDEMGHDVLHREREGGSVESAPLLRDTVMEAITNWFAYQMHVLDNVEKTAIIHLVIENASAAYHARAMPVLAKYTNQQYFDVHVEADHEHAAMGVALLGQESPRTYARLKDIVGEAWDMVGAMVDRVAELTQTG